MKKQCLSNDGLKEQFYKSCLKKERKKGGIMLNEGQIKKGENINGKDNNQGMRNNSRFRIKKGVTILREDRQSYIQNGKQIVNIIQGSDEERNIKPRKHN